MYVSVYVDDILIAWDSGSPIFQFKVKISGRFNVTDLGTVNRFVGMEISYNVTNKVMTLSQRAFIEKVAKKFRVETSKPIYSPIESDLNLERADKCNVNLPYRQLVGCLLYISIITRPDVSFAINYLSRFTNCFSNEHFLYLKRVLMYLCISF